MDALLKKMNFKEGMSGRVWNVSVEFASWKEQMKDMGYFSDSLQQPDFLLAFVKTEEEVEQYLEKMLPYLTGDQVFWMAYPKKSSKKYKSEINRDSGWAAFAKYDFEVVRNVAMDADWSALRFRHVKYIKSMTRKFSIKDQL